MRSANSDQIHESKSFWLVYYMPQRQLQWLTAKGMRRHNNPPALLVVPDWPSVMAVREKAAQAGNAAMNFVTEMER